MDYPNLPHNKTEMELKAEQFDERLRAVEAACKTNEIKAIQEITSELLNKYSTLTEALQRCENKYDLILQKMEAFEKRNPNN